MTIYPLPHMPVVKDLVPDLTNFYAQYASIKPWLQTDDADAGEGVAAVATRTAQKLDGLYECILCACCSTVVPELLVEQRALPRARPRCCRRTAGSSTARDEATGERLDDLEDPFRLYRCHTIMNCAKACPKGLNPAKAIAEIKKHDGRAAGVKSSE